MGVVKDGRASHLDLAQAEIHGNRFGNVQKSSVASNCKGKAVKRLQDVSALVNVKQACSCLPFWSWFLLDYLNASKTFRSLNNSRALLHNNLRLFALQNLPFALAKLFSPISAFKS